MNGRRIMLRLLRYLKPHVRKLILAFGVLLLATAADVLGPALAKIFIDNYLAPRIFTPAPLILLGGGYLTLVILSALLHYLQLISFNQIALKIIQEMRVEVFNKVQYLGLGFFDRTPGGTLVSRITNDTEAVKELFLSVLSTYIQNVVIMLGIFAAMFAMDKRLAAFCLLLLPAVFILMWIYRKLSSQVYRSLRHELARLNAKLNESIQGMNLIQAMRQERRFRNEFGEINEAYYKSGLANIRLEALLMRPANHLIYILALVLVLSYFGVHSLLGPIQLGVLYAFVNYLDRFFEPVNMIMMRLSQLQQAIISAERVFELMDEDYLAPGHIKDQNERIRIEHQESKEDDVKKLQCTSWKMKEGVSWPVIEQGLIEFRKVSFSYDGVTEVLKNISFTVKPGQTVALVGHTGSGKSTIANLIMRFYPVAEGEILIDGVPLMKYSEKELRTKLGLVAQEPFLFAGDIEKNICLERPDISKESMIEAVEYVQADQFITKLPQEYKEVVSERGATLSSGQRQLISFARTMAGQPKILVLDEATASIDTETEEAIQFALQKMRQGRSTIAIAHRLSTIQEADLILVLHRGEIVERGTHSELIAKESLYFKLWQLQRQNPAF